MYGDWDADNYEAVVLLLVNIPSISEHVTYLVKMILGDGWLSPAVEKENAKKMVSLTLCVMRLDIEYYIT